MTRRARLSLDPAQRSKAAPPHGFETPPAASDAREPADETAAAAGSAGNGAEGARQTTGHWRADRPQPAGAAEAPTDAVADAGVTGTAATARPAGALLASVRVLSRRPLVRVLAVSVAAGLSLYLLRRRLF